MECSLTGTPHSLRIYFSSDFKISFSNEFGLLKMLMYMIQVKVKSTV